MLRDKAKDEAWIRDVLKRNGVEDTVYVTANHYDGGYEIRVGTTDVFIEYEVIDSATTEWLKRLDV